MEELELVIIGAGAAGLTAGIYGVRSGLKTVVLEEKFAGGTALDASTVENYLGFPSISGSELAQKMVAHAKNAGVTLKELETVVSVDLKNEMKRVQTQKGNLHNKGCHSCFWKPLPSTRCSGREGISWERRQLLWSL